MPVLATSMYKGKRRCMATNVRLEVVGGATKGSNSSEESQERRTTGLTLLDWLGGPSRDCPAADGAVARERRSLGPVAMTQEMDASRQAKDRRRRFLFIGSESAWLHAIMTDVGARSGTPGCPAIICRNYLGEIISANQTSECLREHDVK